MLPLPWKKTLPSDYRLVLCVNMKERDKSKPSPLIAVAKISAWPIRFTPLLTQDEKIPTLYVENKSGERTKVATIWEYDFTDPKEENRLYVDILKIISGRDSFWVRVAPFFWPHVERTVL